MGDGIVEEATGAGGGEEWGRGWDRGSRKDEAGGRGATK